MKGRDEIAQRSGHISNASRQPTWDGRTNISQYDQAFSSTLGKEGMPCPYDRRAGYQRGDEIMGRIANSLTLSNKGRGGYQGAIPPTVLASRTAGPKSRQPISSGPSAIDLFDQCGVVPSGTTDVGGLVGASHCARASQEPAGGGSGVVDSVGRKAADVDYPPASTLQAVRPPIIPDGPLGRGEKGRLRDPRRHEARVRNAIKSKADAIDGQSRSPTARGQTTAASRSAQQGLSASSGRGAMVSKNGGRKLQGVGNSIESTVKGLCRGRSNANLRETQAPPAQADRARRRWNVGGDASAALVPSAPRAGRKEDAPQSSYQRVLTAKVRLHKSKDLNALKSEHMEALSILQDISSPSTSAARSAIADQSGDDVAAQATGGLLHERFVSAAASSDQAFITETASVCPGAAPKVEFGPDDADVDKLSADLPRIGSEEQAALRSLYRKWWMKIANGGSPPSPYTPNPVELSRIRKRVGGAAAVDTGRDAGRQKGARPPVGKQSSTRQPVGASNGKRRVVAKPSGVVTKPVGVVTKLAGASGNDKRRVVAKPAGVSRKSVSKKQQPPGFGTDTRSRSLGREKNRTGAAATAFVAVQIALGMAAVLKVKRDEKAAGVKSCRGQRTTSKVRQPNATAKTPQPPPSQPRRINHNTDTSSTSVSVPIAPSSTISVAKSDKPQRHNRGGGGVPLNVARDHRDNEIGGNDSPRPALQHDSDVESVSEDNDLVGEQEEGHDGRIFLADGRFISTRRTSSEAANGDNISNDGRAGVGGVAVGRSVVGDEVPVDSVAEDESLDYADESFEA